MADNVRIPFWPLIPDIATEPDDGYPHTCELCGANDRTTCQSMTWHDYKRLLAYGGEVGFADVLLCGLCYETSNGWPIDPVVRSITQQNHLLLRALEKVFDGR